MKGSATVLLVEDDRALLDGIADVLEVSDIGYDLHVLKASNGLMALEVVDEHEPDLIISDVMMPKMGGFEFLEQLRKRQDWVHIPLIFLTAKGTPEDVLKGRVSGAELYITKPYDSDELLQMIRSQLDRAFQLQGDRKRRLDRFSRNIVQLLNHEFRTPLTYVTVYYELLADGLLHEEPGSVREYLNGIQVGSKRLGRLVGNLVKVLELRTGEAAKKVEQESVVIEDLGQLLIDLFEERRLEGSAATLSLTWDIPGELPKIWGHRESLVTIFDCLVDNAIKFSLKKPGSLPQVIVSAKPSDGDVLVSVADNGLGIPESAIHDIFELFYQHNRDEFEQQGAGAGLTIAKGLVELHGGQLMVESQEGIGSTFTVLLPAIDESSGGAGGVAGELEANRTATILLVEDEWYLLEGLCDLLEVFESRYKFNVLTASNGLEALDILEDRQPDLILTDIMMPKMNGYQLLKETRKNPALLQIPFVFLTAKGERRDVLHGRSLGAEEYVTKPYDAAELFAVIEAQLDRHFQRQGAINQGFEELKRSILDLLTADLHMPLGVVSDYAQKLETNLERMRSDKDLMAYLRGIQGGSKQVTKLVEDFITLVELRTGKSTDWFALQARPTDINEVLMDVGHFPGNSVDWTRVTARRKLDPEAGMVLINPELLVKCLRRMVSLIIDLGRDLFEIDLLITSSRVGDRVSITLGTEAVSLTVEEAKRVNDLLSRPEAIVLELSEYDPALLIAKGVVHYHDGTIAIDVEKTQGLEFTLTFPVFQPS